MINSFAYESPSVEIKAPNPIRLNMDKGLETVFLAGSIENGSAQPWQNRVVSALLTKFNILNPRRDNFADVEQVITDPVLYQQIDWEINGLEMCDFIIMYFDPSTKSPISLLELGLFAGKKEIYLCCPDGFYRKGNVDYIANKFHNTIRTFNDLDSLIRSVRFRKCQKK